jgi:enoyl-CoA hydratase/carnithine racemase
VHRSEAVDLIKLDVADGIAILRLDAPPVNAIDLPVTERLLAALQDLAAQGITGVVVTGAGKAFSAGVNFKVVPTYDADQKRAMVRTVKAQIRRQALARMTAIVEHDDDPMLRHWV